MDLASCSFSWFHAPGYHLTHFKSEGDRLDVFFKNRTVLLLGIPTKHDALICVVASAVLRGMDLVASAWDIGLPREPLHDSLQFPGSRRKTMSFVTARRTPLLYGDPWGSG